MKKSSFAIPLLVVAVFLSGCALKPPPYVAPPASAKIGFMMLTDDQPRHFHVGTMRFQNFIRTGVSDWEFKNRINSYAMEKLDGLDGQQLVLIEPTPLLKSRATKMIKPGWDSLLFNDDLESDVLAAVQGQNLDYLLTVEPIQSDIEYGTSVQASNYGLYTRCHFIDGCKARALTHFTVRAYAMNPVRLAAMIDIGGSSGESIDPSVYLTWPEDVKTLPAEQVDLARDIVMQYTFRSIDMVTRNAGFKTR